MATSTYQVTFASKDALEAAKSMLKDEDIIGDPKNLGYQEKIKGVTYHILENEEAKKGYFSHFASFLDKDKGWRLFKTFESVINLLTKGGVKFSEGMNNVATRAGDYWKFAAVANVIPTSREAVKAYGKLWDKKDITYIPGEVNHKVMKACQKSFGALAMGGYAVSAIAGCFSGLGAIVSRLSLKTADTFDFGDKGIQLHFARQTYNRATEALEGAKTKEVKQCFAETARLAMIRVAQAICSIIGFVFGLMFILGSTFVPPLVALSVSVAGNFLAIWATIYAKSMKYGEVKFFDHKHVLSVA